MANLGGVKVHSMTEGLSQGVEVTSYPVEKGEAISAHVKKTSDTFSVTGYILSKPNKNYTDATRQYNKLVSMMKSGKVVTFSGRDKVTSCVITAMTKDSTKDVRNGVALTISLQHVRIAKSPVTKKKKAAAKKTTVKKSSKKFVKVKRGDTYWAASVKYGTNLKKLMAFPENKWKARFIPIGVKMRVK